MITIVGAGLFGAVARDLLRARGIACQTIDDGRPLAGSYPAGCLTKPSWLASVTNRDAAMSLLDQLYGRRTIPIRVGPLKLDSVAHYPPAAILRPADIRGTVVSVNPQDASVRLSDGRLIRADAVLVAAGVWCRELLPEHFSGIRLTALQGCSQRFAGALPEARLKVWAPFKQSVAFNIEPGVVWFGDGTALKPESFNQTHVERSLAHAEDVGLDRSALIETRIGLRPYVRGQAGWFRRVGPRCWVSTGGAKNGVVLAAAQAIQFLNEIEGGFTL